MAYFEDMNYGIQKVKVHPSRENAKIDMRIMEKNFSHNNLMIKGLDGKNNLSNDAKFGSEMQEKLRSHIKRMECLDE